MFRMHNFIVRFCLKCPAIPYQNRANHLILSPITHCSLPKRCQSSSNSDKSKLIDGNKNKNFDYKTDSPYSNIDFEAITKGNAEKLKALKILQLEIDLLRQQGKRVPTHLSTERWKDMLAFVSAHQRLDYLEFLWLIEMKRKYRKKKSQIKFNLYLEDKAKLEQTGPKIKTTSSPIEYALTNANTSLFHRILDRTMNHFYNYKLLQAEWFGPKVIVDCSYEPFMDMKDLRVCVTQMVLMWSDNRDHVSPYDIVYCNVNEQSFLWQQFTRRIPTIIEDDSPVHFIQQHYLDVFPKEKLVYLTPHCHEILEEYSHDDFYIIGAFVDSDKNRPLSLAKAKKEGLRMAKFPLDKYLQWAVDSKALNLNEVLAILNDLRDGQSWSQVLKHVSKIKAVPINSIYRDEDEKFNPRTAKGIRENYQKTIVYNLLLKERTNGGSKKS